MVILGGMGNVWGVMLGGFVLAYLNFQGLGAIGNKFNSSFGTNVNVRTYQYGIFGIIIVSMMLFRPQGLIPGKRRALELEVGVHDSRVRRRARRGAGLMAATALDPQTATC